MIPSNLTVGKYYFIYQNAYRKGRYVPALCVFVDDGVAYYTNPRRKPVFRLLNGREVVSTDVKEVTPSTLSVAKRRVKKLQSMVEEAQKEIAELEQFFTEQKVS